MNRTRGFKVVVLLVALEKILRNLALHWLAMVCCCKAMAQYGVSLASLFLLGMARTHSQK